MKRYCAAAAESGVPLSAASCSRAEPVCYREEAADETTTPVASTEKKGEFYEENTRESWILF